MSAISVGARLDRLPVTRFGPGGLPDGYYVPEADLDGNGGCPVTSSNNTSPKEKISVAGLTGSPSICSGEVYRNVPAKPIAADSSAILQANPKSSTLMRPSWRKRMFSGLMSP